MKIKLKNLLPVFIILFGFHSTCLAQQMTSNIESLSKEADLILTGMVVEQKSEWNKNRTKIFTHVTVEVDEYLKGANNQSRIVVSHLGGEVGDIGELYSHMPKFEDNEEVLVFLKKDEKNTHYKVLNGEEGKITIMSNPKTGEKVTTSNVRVNSLKTKIKSYINDY